MVVAGNKKVIVVCPLCCANNIKSHLLSGPHLGTWNTKNKFYFYFVFVESKLSDEVRE